MNEYYYADLLKSRMLNEKVQLRLIERWIQPWQYKQNRLFGKRLICATTVIGLLAIFAFVGCSKIPSAEANDEQEFNISTCPLYGMQELELTERKLKWTQKVLKQERAERNKSISSNEKVKEISSPFIPYLQPLAKKYHKSFNLSEREMANYLAALLKNETGNSKRFVPKSRNQKYLQLGDGGNGCHAWQVDKRWHKGWFKLTTFEESGDYAISKVLLVGYQRAKAKGIADPHRAALTYYNSGQFKDKYSTHYYGQRALKAWKGIA
jgi:hypothetical protein